MVGARWCTPVGWVPANDIPGTRFDDGAWRSREREVAGIVYFTNGKEGQVVEANLDELGVAARVDWHVMENVVVDGAASSRAGRHDAPQRKSITCPAETYAAVERF